MKTLVNNGHPTLHLSNTESLIEAQSRGISLRLKYKKKIPKEMWDLSKNNVYKNYLIESSAR